MDRNVARGRALGRRGLAPGQLKKRARTGQREQELDGIRARSRKKYGKNPSEAAVQNTYRHNHSRNRKAAVGRTRTVPTTPPAPGTSRPSKAALAGRLGARPTPAPGTPRPSKEQLAQAIGNRLAPRPTKQRPGSAVGSVNPAGIIRGSGGQRAPGARPPGSIPRNRPGGLVSGYAGRHDALPNTGGLSGSGFQNPAIQKFLGGQAKPTPGSGTLSPVVRKPRPGSRSR